MVASEGRIDFSAAANSITPILAKRSFSVQPKSQKWKNVIQQRYDLTETFVPQLFRFD